MDIGRVGRLAFYEAVYSGTEIPRQKFWRCLEAAGFEAGDMPVDLDVRAALWRVARDVARRESQ